MPIDFFTLAAGLAVLFSAGMISAIISAASSSKSSTIDDMHRSALDLLKAADFTLNVLLENCISDGREVSRENKVQAQMMLRLAMRKAGLPG